MKGIALMIMKGRGLLIMKGTGLLMVLSATFLRRTSASEKSLDSSQLGEFECEISPG